MNYFQQYLAEEFAEDYQEGRLTRRDALKMIASVTGSLLLADSMLAACNPVSSTTATPTSANSAGVPVTSFTDTPMPQASAQPSSTRISGSTDTPASGTAARTTPGAGQVNLDDDRIEAGAVQFPGSGATLQGYLSRPKGKGPFAVVLVCHENRGLTSYIQDVTRRLAVAGYAALAVDLLSRQGGSQALNAGDIPGALGNMPPDQFVADFQSGYQYLQGQAFVQAERVGMVGFCFGGGVTWQVAIHMPELRAAVPYYGPLPPPDQVTSIQAAVLAIYGGKDQRINQSIPPVEEAMQKNNKIFQKIIYPDADHAFHNDTGPRYNPEAAQDAWARTLGWFSKYLG